jgi:hypothetical protein
LREKKSREIVSINSVRHFSFASRTSVSFSGPISTAKIPRRLTRAQALVSPLELLARRKVLSLGVDALVVIHVVLLRDSR